jgi:AcrR family transcriptional regulator
MPARRSTSPPRRRAEPSRAVRRSRTARQYHHGNLREALIEAGLELIQQKGVAALTLREIGARVGVSRMAAYRHFADRAALLAAISEAGFVRFGDSLEEARQSAPKDKEGFRSRLHAMAVAYVRFAAAHPAHYQVMFGAARDPHTPPSAAGARSFGILEDTIRQGQEKGVVRPGNSTDLARAVWCMVHGISTLAATGRLGQEASGPRFTLFCADILEAGLLAKV